jgi:hypothetical protein
MDKIWQNSEEIGNNQQKRMYINYASLKHFKHLHTELSKILKNHNKTQTP